MRIGICGFSSECCTFSPISSGKDDFTALKAEQLLASYDFLGDFPDVTFVPLLRARALPGGKIDGGFYCDTKAELIGLIKQAGPLDGIFLHMHGAAYVQGAEDLEGDFTSAVRQASGAECLLSASYDLHGNLSRSAFENLDILTAYRTAPHIDEHETVKRAFGLLIDALRTGTRPSKAFVRVPILLPGEKTSTDWEPGMGLYREIEKVIERHDLDDASILIGYAWADEPRVSASVVAYGQDAENTKSAAELLARRLWDVRAEFDFGTFAGSTDQCIRQATTAGDGLSIISDSGDNPTAGGVGDVPYVLQRILALGVSDAIFASIADPETVSLCKSIGVGNQGRFALGGKLDSINGPPLKVTGKVVGVYEVTRRYGVIDDRNHTAVLNVSGILVIVTEKRTPFHYLDDFKRLELNPLDHPLLTVKIGYLVPELQAIADRSFLALSPGAVNQDLTALPYRRIQRPIYPLDQQMAWSP
ncbi:MAG: M81 family metallopeptidase [Phycisphaerales bacterium]|jgi:microcystin degradation protein MlrC|nr:M81 family metallopeptidase [Phycisphaerales bacterium]